MDTLLPKRSSPLHAIDAYPLWLKTRNESTAVPTTIWLNYEPKESRARVPIKAKRRNLDKGAEVKRSDYVRDEEINSDDDSIPTVVWERMMVRILVFVGTPMATGVALLVLFSALKEHSVWDVPLWLPFLTTLLCFGTSAVGIAYGTLSTSLDPEKKGSVLGWEQVQRNWPEMWSTDDESNAY